MTFDHHSRIVIVDDLIAASRELFEAARAAEHQNRDEANEAEGAMISRYDTFKEEAQYLQSGHQLRALELERGIETLRALRQQLERGLGRRRGTPPARAVAGTFVLVEDPEGRTRWYFLAPFGGGKTCRVDGRDVAVITPQTPVGRAVLGAEEGDLIEVVNGRGAVENVIVEIA